MAILKIVQGTTRILDLDELYRFITQAILRELRSFYHASIWIKEPTGQFLTPKSISGPNTAEFHRIHPHGYRQRLDTGILGHVYGTGKAYVTNNTVSDPYYLKDITPRSKSELCVPIKERRTVIGLINVESTQTDVFTNADVLAFQILAEHIANSIKNAKVYEDLKTINRQLLEFQILARQISSTLDLQEILNTTIQRLPEIMGLRLCSVFLLNPVTNALELRCHNHRDLDDKRISLKTTESRILNRVVGLSRSQWIQNVETELHRRNRRKYITKSSLNLVLKAGEKLVGVLNLNDKLNGENFSEHDFNLSDYFASHLALSINNCHLYERTLQMALFDGLTGLYVHRHFQEMLDREIARSARTKTIFTLMLADIDHFKRINDTYGHQSGDTVLRALAGIFKRVVRQIDFAARYGGEEFAFILPDTDKQKAEVLAARIQRAVNATRFRINGRRCRITLSFGIAETDGSIGKDDLIRRTDQALYLAKKQGRNLIVIDES